MKTTISKLSNDFRTNMVNCAYQFDAKLTNKPLMSDCELMDFYCMFCGCNEKPIEEPFSWSTCPCCGGV